MKSKFLLTRVPRFLFVDSYTCVYLYNVLKLEFVGGLKCVCHCSTVCSWPERTVQNVKYGLITKPDLRTSENNGNFTVNVVYKKSFRLYSNENHQIHRMESNAFLVRLKGQNPGTTVRFMVRFCHGCFVILLAFQGFLNNS